MSSLEREILDLFVKKKKTLALAESCTGGGVAASLVKVPDASKYFLGGIVAYSNEAKIELLKVSKETLEKFGAVSEEAAVEMAIGAMKAFGSDCGLAVTGIAGPSGGSKEKPVGMVCFAIVSGEKSVSWTSFFQGGREKVMEAAMQESLVRLKNF